MHPQSMYIALASNDVINVKMSLSKTIASSFLIKNLSDIGMRVKRFLLLKRRFQLITKHDPKIASTISFPFPGA